MTRSEIEQAYPDCPDAVEDCEETIRPATWTTLRNMAIPAEKAVLYIKRSMEDWERLTGGRRELPQMDAPGFFRYVAVKLGQQGAG